MAEMKEMEKIEALVVKLDKIDDDDEAAIEKTFYATTGVTPEDVSEELTEDDLEDVTGGGLSEIGVLKWLAKNTSLGKLTWKSTKVAARCLYDACKYGDPYRTYSESYIQGLSDDLDKKIPEWMKALGGYYK